MFNKKGFVLTFTGNIASGKSFFSSLFKKKAVLFSFDSYIHSLLFFNPSVKKKIFQFFPFVNVNNNISRYKLSHVVFRDEASMRILNNILYPYIQFVIQKLHFYSFQYKILFVIEHPLLFEKNHHFYFDLVFRFQINLDLLLLKFSNRFFFKKNRFFVILNYQLFYKIALNKSNIHMFNFNKFYLLKFLFQSTLSYNQCEK